MGIGRRHDALTRYLVRRLIFYTLSLGLCIAVLDGVLDMLMRDLPAGASVPWQAAPVLLAELLCYAGFIWLFAGTIRERVRRENERAVAERTRLMADLGHDLRSPLTSVKGYARAIADGRLSGAQDVVRAAQTVCRRAQDMEGLIGQMLDAARAEQPEPTPAAPMALVPALREALAEYYPRFQEKNMALDCDLSGDGQAAISKEQLRRAFDNILLNALSHCDAGARVRVSTRRRRGEVEIAVADTGAPIPEELRDNIFDPFVRLDESRAPQGGHGLGLGIARGIARRHGGSLSLTDAQPPYRKAFVLSFPVRQ